MKGHTGEVTKIKWNPTHPEHLATCSGTMGTSTMRKSNLATFRAYELLCLSAH